MNLLYFFLQYSSPANHFPVNGCDNKSQQKENRLSFICQLRTNGMERISAIVRLNRMYISSGLEKLTHPDANAASYLF